MTVEFINPSNGLPLKRVGDELVDEVGERFPVIRGIPRLCSGANYTDNFGMQWNTFQTTQLDRAEAGLDLTEQRFFRETEWRGDLAGQNILEVGSGAGRFSKTVLERTTACLWSVDYSNAVDANMRNNGAIAPDRFRVCQASIYELPFADGSFDKTVCLGVLQHTPDFEASVRALVSKTKGGGEIVVDFYPIKGWWSKLNAKYILRPITRKMPHDRLLKLIDRNIDWMMSVHRALTKIGLGAVTRFLPIADLRCILPSGLTPKAAREWALLDTFDMFSPEYDNPQRVEAVAAMFRRSGASVTFAGFVDVGNGTHAAVVRAKRDR